MKLSRLRQKKWFLAPGGLLHIDDWTVVLRTLEPEEKVAKSGECGEGSSNVLVNKVAKDSDREKNQPENLKGEPEMAMKNRYGRGRRRRAGRDSSDQYSTNNLIQSPSLQLD